MEAAGQLVGIVIPGYNCQRWTGEAIDSALAQTYPHCEIIVGGDGSPKVQGSSYESATAIGFVTSTRRIRGVAPPVIMACVYHLASMSSSWTLTT